LVGAGDFLCAIAPGLRLPGFDPFHPGLNGSREPWLDMRQKFKAVQRDDSPGQNTGIVEVIDQMGSGDRSPNGAGTTRSFPPASIQTYR